MTLNLKRTRELLQSFDFKTLFIEELGWDHYKTQLQPITIDSHDFLLTAMPKSGVWRYFNAAPLKSKSRIMR